MAGTVEGGKRAAEKNLASDPEFYNKIGSMGGKKGAADGVIKGFAAMTPEKRREAGRKGGWNGRRKA